MNPSLPNRGHNAISEKDFIEQEDEELLLS